MNKLIDLAPGTGVFTGDLRYGRRNGSIAVKGKDFTGEDNLPVVPLVLVSPRDEEIWKKDPRVKQVKRLPSSQHSINHIIDVYQQTELKSNITLKVGKQRL